MSLKRLSRGDAPLASADCWPSLDKEAKRFPDLFAFLSCRSWPDGEVRVTGTLLIFVDERAGELKACLKDRDSDRQCFVTANTFLDLLAAIEGVASGEKGDWRASRYDKSTKRSRS